MLCFACASVASRETWRHLVYQKTEYLVPLSLSTAPRNYFYSTTPHRRSSPAGSENSNIVRRESSSKIDHVQVPFHGAVPKAKRHQRTSPDLKWKHTSSHSHSKQEIELRDDSLPRFRGKPGSSQSYSLRENSVHRSSQDAFFGPRHKISSAATGSRSEGYSSTIDINRTGRFRNLRFNMHSHGETPRDSSRISRIQTLNSRSRSEYSVTSENGMSSAKVPRESWQVQKKALLEKFGSSGWSPRKRLSPDALEGIRMLHSQSPDKYTTPVLADHFEVSPEAIRRILKSKWRPNEEEEAKRRERWDKRGESIWSQMVEIGIKPPKKWRDMGVGKPRTRSAGTSVGNKPSIKETLLAAIKPWDSDGATKGSRVISSPVPLSERIL